MKVEVDAWAWIPKADLDAVRLEALRAQLTVHPKVYRSREGHKGPIKLYVEEYDRIGIPRGFFQKHKQPNHEVVDLRSPGASFPDTLLFNGRLYDEQRTASDTVIKAVESGGYGGIVRAPTGWGKTVLACELVSRLNVPTLVLVHREFLLDQWVARMGEFLPGASVGVVQADRAEFRGRHVSVAMVETLANRIYTPEISRRFGLVITDEVHVIGAHAWAPILPNFSPRFRLGISATPKRKDGADSVFLHHIGPMLFWGNVLQLIPQIRRVWSKFRVRDAMVTPDFLSDDALIDLLLTNEARNVLIVDQITQALKAGRKCLIMSLRLNHLNTLRDMLLRSWSGGSPPSTGFFVGRSGMPSRQAKAEFDAAAKTQAIFATAQFCSLALDVPALDTLFLVAPMPDVEQPVGRILRPFEGKKPPIVVDLRDDLVTKFKGWGEKRDALYERLAKSPTANRRGA